MQTEQIIRSKELFSQFGGTLRTSQALQLGIHPRTLYEMRDKGDIVQLSRGIYRLTEAPKSEHTDLAAIAARVPTGVICLISALSFHQLTDEIPHQVYLAIPRGKETPRVDYPPARSFHFSAETINAGVEVHEIEGIKVRIFSPEKTIADCFKFRHKIGLDVTVTALKECLRQKGARAKILEYAKLCRVEKVMRPFLEALQ
jgi:predicted transcriptional regulator of viral defense system